MKLRGAIVVIHRYAGLYMALFLTVAGATGTIMVFRPELDRWLNPDLYAVAHREAPELDPFALRERAEEVSGGPVRIVNFARRPGEPLRVKISDMTMESGGAHEAEAVLLVDPYDGKPIRRVSLAPWPLTRESLLPFVVKLHFTLLLGDLGRWLFGVAALIWTLDSFLAVYLTLPAAAHKAGGARRSWWALWSASWRVKFPASAFRLNFDLHRAGALWLWPALLLFAWSSVYFNLNREVYLPAMSALFDMPAKAGAALPPVEYPAPSPALGWRAGHAVGRALMEDEARRRGFRILNEDSLEYDESSNVFYYTVRSSFDVAESFSATYVVFDAASGKLRGFDAPTGLFTGYTLTSWIVALHLASLWGLPWKLCVAVAGAGVAMLSATGVYIWQKKRVARLTARHPAAPARNKLQPHL